MLSGSGSSPSPSADTPEFGLLGRSGPLLNTFTTSGIAHQEARVNDSILVSHPKNTLECWAPERANALSGENRLEGRVGFPDNPSQHFQ